MNCNVKWKGGKNKIDEIKICVIFEFELNSRKFSGENSNRPSEMSMGRIFGPGEREPERYVTGIVC